MEEQRASVREDADEQVSLSGLEADVKLPGEKPHARRLRRMLLACAALIALAAATATGYRYLRGSRVELIANKRLQGQSESGKDVRQAAFETISGALTSPTPTPSPGGLQTSSAPPAEAAGERVPAPVQAGIAATIAPPESFVTPDRLKQAQWSEHSGGASQVTAKGQPVLMTPAPPRRDVTRSIRFAPPPKPVAAARPEAEVTARTAMPVNAGGVIDRADGGSRTGIEVGQAAQPAFGAMLPVRLMGVLYTLRPGSLARLELVRDIEAERWRLRRGTVFVGSVIGGDLDRAYVQIKGYIDPESQGLVRLDGELLGSDGGSGLRGRRRRASPVWVKVLDRVAQAGTQIAAGILSRQGSSVIIASDPYGTYRSTSEDGAPQLSQNRNFVEVPAGAVGFVTVTTLPEQIKPASHLADGPGRDGFSDEELAELMSSSDPTRIRAALPRMGPELRQVALTVLREIEAAGK